MSEKRPALDLTREQVLAFRRRVGGLDERAPLNQDSLRQAACAGLQDSMPRAALLSLHARVAGIGPSAWEDPSLAQLWGPRYSAYVVPRSDVAIFSLGRLPDGGKQLGRAEDIANRLDGFLAGRRLDAVEAAQGLGIHPNALRYAAPTGRVLIRWDGARQPTVWTIPAPNIDPRGARLELARRYVHVFGPTTAEAFAGWAGMTPPMARAALDALAPSLAHVRTPIGDGWILAEDEPIFRVPPGIGAPARLLPSGDTFYLLQGSDRQLLVPDAARRGELWTSRVWPGALLVDGEIAGTWRRAGAVVQVQPWRALSRAERDAVEREVARSSPRHTGHHTLHLDPAVIGPGSAGTTHGRNDEMTATTTNIGTRRGQAALGQTRRLAQVAGSLVATIGSRWNDFVDAGQLGPSADSVTSRHTGGRI